MTKDGCFRAFADSSRTCSVSKAERKIHVFVTVYSKACFEPNHITELKINVAIIIEIP